MVLKCLFTYLITSSNIYNSFSGGNEKKKVKPLGSCIVRTVKACGQSCNIPPICDKMVLKCLFTYLITRSIIYNSFSGGNEKKKVKTTWE